MVGAQQWMDAQYSVLGSALIDSRCVPAVMGGTSEFDYTGPCLTIFKAMQRVFLSGKPVDPVVVLDAVGKEYGGFIRDLMDITPTAANVGTYMEICRKQSRLARIREIADRIQSTESFDDVRTLIEQAAGLLVDKNSGDVVTMEEALRSFMERHSGDPVEYLTWPIYQLNGRTFAELGDFIIIGGEPSTGKTAWALQCAYHFAKKYKVGFFTMETKSDKLVDRKMAKEFDMHLEDIKKNNFRDDDWDRIAERSSVVLSHNLEFVRAPAYSVSDIQAKTMERGYQIIFVDYLQLINSPGTTRAAIVTNSSIGLHTMSQSMGVAVFALSQLTLDGFKNSAPGIDDLRESRQIGQDADIVMILTHEDKKNKDGPRWLDFSKNKEGRTGSILVDFDGDHQHFRLAGPKRKKEDKAQPMQQMSLLSDDTQVPFGS